MLCPFCRKSIKNTRVIDTREVPDGIRRRRQCERCNERFTTYERVATVGLMVSKSDKRREPFNRDKLTTSIRLACTKLPVSSEIIAQTITKIEEQLYDIGKREINSAKIGELAMERLKEIDDVAYIRFASVYLGFADVDSMAAEIKQLQTDKRREVERRSQMPLPIES
ncbi:transcriptional regulator NrdR [Anaerolineales bacterium HSG6]|nr:transcriptional regulator NrdR [Anaerolineales bacterium HSG6]MDM8533031.1 transcriptional regulator NrdR [Anaerolineales bacterium HSG25]